MGGVLLEHQQQADSRAENPLVNPDEHIKKQIEKLNLNRPAIRFTPHGEVMVRRQDGVEHQEDFPMEELGDLPEGFELHRDTYIEAMSRIYEACSHIEKMEKRFMPLTRPELLNFNVMGIKIEKRDIGKLVKWGLLSEKVIPITKAGRPIGARAVVYFTPRGRAFVRKYFDPAYCLPKSDS